MRNNYKPVKPSTGGVITLVSCAALLTAIPANADIYCGGDGPALKVLTYADGGVLVYTGWRGDFFQICNLERSWKGVAPGTCFAWMSKVTSGIATNKKTGFWYGGINSGDACKNLPTYSNAPPPVYIDISQ